MNMAQTATARRASKVATPAVHIPTVWELELGATGGELLRQLAEARQERLAGERAEKPLKAAVKALYEPECEDLEQGDILQVLAQGELMGTVARVPGNLQCDWDLLLEAFPEAYQACVTKPDHLRFNPA
jgi:hypothetical protein